MSGSWWPEEFPNLQEQHHEVTSAATNDYNCIAWAAGDIENWWWPDDPEIGYGFWPEGMPRAETILAFLETFSAYGYVKCDDGSLEIGFEKIALYASADLVPTHAARQLSDGCWTSKLGIHEDVKHINLECLQGPCYGAIVAFLRRPIH